MRKAKIFMNGKESGILYEEEKNHNYIFEYSNNYEGDPISLTMPIEKKRFEFENFPPFFDGLLPEGTQLEALLKQKKIDKNDLFKQLTTVGKDLIGAVTVVPMDQNNNE